MKEEKNGQWDRRQIHLFMCSTSCQQYIREEGGRSGVEGSGGEGRESGKGVDKEHVCVGLRE